MAYTVKQLADLSKVSVRTLHFYDEIALLKPACVGDNGYRFYEEEQLLGLQQILFFRELGIELKEIQGILAQPDFDKVEALIAHKEILQRKKARMQELIKTVDKTINKLKGNKKMNDQELYFGFAPEKQAEYEAYLIQSGTAKQSHMAESKRNVAKWKKADWQHMKDSGELMNRALSDALKNGSKPESAEVQALVKAHFEWLKQFWTPDQQSYIGLGQLYCDHADFKKYFEAYQPGFAAFLAKAMTVFAKANLK